MAEMLRVKTLARIDDPQRGGASIRAGVIVKLSQPFAKRLIAEGKAEKAEDLKKK
jgi:hypothetical protein